MKTLRELITELENKDFIVSEIHNYNEHSIELDRVYDKYYIEIYVEKNITRVIVTCEEE